MSETLSKRQRAVKRDDVDRAPFVRSAAGDALSILVVRVLQLDGLLLAAGDTLARPAGQTASRWQVLAAIEAEPNAVAQIARNLNLARQSVQRLADILVADGCAIYIDNPAHARAKFLALTQAGRASLRKIQRAQCNWANELGAQMEESDLLAASATLTTLARMLGN